LYTPFEFHTFLNLLPLKDLFSQKNNNINHVA